MQPVLLQSFRPNLLIYATQACLIEGSVVVACCAAAAAVAAHLLECWVGVAGTV